MLASLSTQAKFKRVHILPWFRKKLEILDVQRTHNFVVSEGTF